MSTEGTRTEEPTRFAVRFSGELTKAAMKALRAHHMGLQHNDTFFASPVPYSTTVVVRAEDDADAVEQVRDALAGHGHYVGFQARRFRRRATALDD